MGKLSSALAALGLDDEGIREDSKRRRIEDAKKQAENLRQQLQAVDTNEAVPRVLAMHNLRHRSSHRIPAQADRDTDNYVLVTHVVTKTEPYEQGYVVYIEVDTGFHCYMPYAAK